MNANSDEVTLTPEAGKQLQRFFEAQASAIAVLRPLIRGNRKNKTKAKRKV